jgi:hypothetical protein
MRVREETFLQESSMMFSIDFDVARMPQDQVASIGFSSYGVVDSCT